MSLVYLKYHNENVLDLEQRDESTKAPPFKYESKFKKSVRQASQCQAQAMKANDGRLLLTVGNGKHGHRTMGYEQTPLNGPKDFLRKHQGVKWLRLHDHNCSKEHKLPPVPRPAPVSSLRAKSKSAAPRTDFIAANIENVRQMQVKPPALRLVDTANGDRQSVREAGLLPQYVYGRNFGKIPCYLKANKQMMRRDLCGAADGAINGHEDEAQMFGIRQMTANERSSLLEGLKANFMEQSRLFQRLSLFTDTLAKKMRKTRIENTLRQLEQDIYLIEKNSVIYVSKY